MIDDAMLNTVWVGDVFDFAQLLPEQSVHAIVTSPPYWKMRKYGNVGELGTESTVDEYVRDITRVFSVLYRVLRDDGTLWLNIGDCYGKGKELQGVPWRVALALQASGWILRCDCVWDKPDSMPESVKDRPTRSHEYVFMLTKFQDYYYDYDAVLQPQKTDYSTYLVKRGFNAKHGNNGERANKLAEDTYNPNGRALRTLWNIPKSSYRGAHIAMFPAELPRLCIRASVPINGIVLDPFMGSGTTAQVAVEEGRNFIGCDLDPRSPEWTQIRLRVSSLP
jgi:DNA modification methylase